MNGSSISCSIRSADASADCSAVYLFEISRSGMKNICAYCMKPMSVPIVIARWSAWPPPAHRITPIVIDATVSTAAKSPVS